MASNLSLKNSVSGVNRNLCFTNVVLQLLRNIPEFKEQLNKNYDFSEIHKEIVNVYSMEGTNVRISAHSVRLEVGKFHNRVDFYSGDQTDAMEFLEHLLLSLHPSIISLFRFNTLIKKKFLQHEIPSC